MDKQLVVVSGLNQRLVVDLGTSAIAAVKAPGDEYTYVLFKKRAKKVGEAKSKPTSADAGEGRGEYPQPKPDIQASLVGGLPEGVPGTQLGCFPIFRDSITFDEISKAFDEVAPGSTSYFVLESDHGG